MLLRRAAQRKGHHPLTPQAAATRLATHGCIKKDADNGNIRKERVSGDSDRIRTATGDATRETPLRNP